MLNRFMPNFFISPPFPGFSENQDLARLSELALVQAKEKGPGTTNFFSQELYDQFVETRERRREIQLGMENSQFVPYYMPIYDAADLSLCGCEMLLRWEHPTRGVLEPAYFLEDLIEVDLLSAVVFSCLDGLVELVRRIRSINPSFRFSINLENSQLMDQSFVERFIDQLGDASPSITVEITEKGEFRVDSSAQLLELFRSRGCQLSLDDFGTGYANLQRLLDLRLDEIKIDQVFIQGLADNSSDVNRKILGGMVDLIHSVGATAVAEGVSTEPLLTYVKEAGIDKIQGYLMSKAVPSEKITELISRS